MIERKMKVRKKGDMERKKEKERNKERKNTVDFFLENMTLVILRHFFYGAILWIIKIAFLGVFDQLLEPHSKMRAC